MIAYLAAEFPECADQGSEVSARRGGRAAAELALTAVKPEIYGATRNYLNGAVTHLGAYVSAGVLSMGELRTAAAGSQKFLSQLGWRDYFHRVYREIGNGVWLDREPYKTGWSAKDYADTLPEELDNATTGLACMDSFSRQLRETGYLHNHARMWVASYLVHWRRVKWQAGAAWFLRHLLDADPAPNNLSWQWVASTFSSKPYIFNRENLERFSGNRYCPDCPARNKCPFDAGYEDLSARLFRISI